MSIWQFLKIVAFQAGAVTACAQFRSDRHGNSTLGTLDAPYYPKFLDDGPMFHGFPWGNHDCQTNAYTTWPNTGVIRTYHFRVHRTTMAPDGYERDMIVVNNQFPGPLIEANWGDIIQVTVQNDLDDEGTSIHWHGFLQQGTNWEDGVPGMSQCPIAPGKSFTYQFQATLSGTSWWHSHYSTQYNAGILGPIIIHGPTHYDYDYDLGPILLSDWYHEDYFKILERVMDPNVTPGITKTVNSLVQGMGNFNCSTVDPGDKTPCTNNAGTAKFRFHRGKRHLMRFVNVGTEGVIRFSIDGHMMTVVATDFVPIEAYNTTVAVLGIGQRIDVIVEANGDQEAYWLRSNLSMRCTNFRDPTTTIGLAAIYYDDADTEREPQSTAWENTDPMDCANDDISLQRPLMKMPMQEPDLVITMDLNFGPNATNSSVWTMGSDTPMRVNYNMPTLLQAHYGNLTFDKEANLFDLGRAQWVRFIVLNHVPIGHNMHVHGYNFLIVAIGNGTWDNKTFINPDNPARRDVVQMPNSGYVVIDVPTHMNEGLFLFHCHLLWHSASGLSSQFLVNPEAIEHFNIPQVIHQTCREWAKFTNTTVPDQIDSGV